MNYAEIKKTDIANGTGVRVSLFVSGCTHRCRGCFNEKTWDFNYGLPFTEDTCSEIIKAVEPVYISGLTLIGGEPLEVCNQRCLIDLLRKIKGLYPEKNIWCYSGYTFETDILNKKGKAHSEVTDEFISMIDVLVDGEFILAKRNLCLKFRGSENQRIILVKESLTRGKTVLSPLNK